MLFFHNIALFLYFTGNLALSRALGDFVFKKNDKKRPEEQIVTGKIGKQAALILKLLTGTIHTFIHSSLLSLTHLRAMEFSIKLLQ